MSATLWKSATSNGFSTTIDGSITLSDNTITLTTTATLQAPGVLVIDRQNSDEVDTPNLREYITYTGISTNTLTGVTRGVAGSSAQGHASGAIVEETMSVTHWLDLQEWLAVSHNSSGNIATNSASIATLNTSDIRIVNSINASGASLIGFDLGSGTGGLNGVLQYPGNLPTSATDALGGLPIAINANLSFFNLFLRTPASGASVLLTVKKYPNTVLGVIGLLAGATFASSSSFSSGASLAVGEELIADITNASATASDIKLLIRGV